MAGNVHHPASAAMTPPVAATENSGPTLETDNGTRSQMRKDWRRRRCEPSGSRSPRGGTLVTIRRTFLLTRAGLLMRADCKKRAYANDERYVYGSSAATGSDGSIPNVVDAGTIGRRAATVSALVAARLARGTEDRDRPRSALGPRSAKTAAQARAVAEDRELLRAPPHGPGWSTQDQSPAPGPCAQLSYPVAGTSTGP
jgi:hypothetical protein